jgi:hypothetical protein
MDRPLAAVTLWGKRVLRPVKRADPEKRMTRGDYLREGRPFDHQDPRERCGILFAKLRKAS